MGIKKRIISNLICFISEARLTLNFPKIYKEIKNVLDEESLWKDKPRKSYFIRLLENIVWYLKNKEACIYYNSYGLDIKNFRDKSQYLPYRQFRIERFMEDYPESLYNNKLCILRDKILFSAYLGEVLGKNYVIETKGKIYPDGIFYNFETKKSEDIRKFLESRNTDTFIKKLNGECGDGCYLIKPKDNLDGFLNEILGSEYIVQDRIIQHDDVNAINPSCINTIRIITIVGRKSKTPSVFSHYMRVGCNAINDNRATGGVGEDISDEGHMLKYGVGHHKVEAQHFITNKVYENTLIPYWKEVKELVIKAHSFLLEIPTIGWDVAITPKGPVLLEGNDNWEISGAQDSAGGLRDKWYELHNI